MNLKKVFQNTLSEKNPLAVSRRKKMRRQLKNYTPTLLCPNCIGGILFHDLGLKFQSPTVNLMLFQQDCAKFVMNMDYYLAQDFVFYDDPEYDCLCAHLGDITVHFTHYKTQEEAVQKWKERSQRIDPENTFVFLMERDQLTYKQMKQLGNLNVRGLVIFTAHEYPDLPYCLYVPEYAAEGEVGNILEKSYLDDSRKYEKIFDFVKWFNEADGNGYDISAYAKL